MMTIEDQMQNAIQYLPGDATMEDAMEQLYLLYKVELGIAGPDAGRQTSQAQAHKKMRRWLARKIQ